MIHEVGRGLKQMPKGIIAVKWDDTKGTVLRAKHPGDLQLTPDEMMRIFTSHAMGEGKAGFMSMKLETMNVASYYTGLAARGEAQYYIALLLSAEEDAGIFEEPLTESARELVKRIAANDFQDLLMKNYELLSVYVKLSLEQRLALILLDPARKLIFKKLAEGCMAKIELQEWLEQELGTSVSDIDLLLVPLIRTNLIRKAVVEGVTGDCIFLIRDMFATFAPPETVMTRILKGEIKGNLGKSVRGEIADFFKQYKVSDDAVGEVAQILGDTNLYKLVTLLRDNLAKKEQLATAFDKSMKEVEKLIKSLMKSGIVSEVPGRGDDGNKYLLKADPQILLFFPEYMIDNIREKWTSGELSKGMAIKYLQILKEEFSMVTGIPRKAKPEKIS